MARGDAVRADRRGDPGQEFVAYAARAGLGREAALPAEGRYVELLHGGGNAELLRHGGSELCLVGGLFPPEHVVQVGDMQGQVELLRQCLKNAQEADRIRTSRHCREHDVAGGQHAVFPDGFFDL